MKPIKFKAYCIANEQGELLNYIQGSLYWSECDSLEILNDCTKFASLEERNLFLDSRTVKIPYDSIKTITYKLK